MTNPDASLVATANWRTDKSLSGSTDEQPTHHTELDFVLHINDAGALLERAGRPRVLKNGSGTLWGNLNWRGSPNVPDYASLNGNLAVDLRHGEILKVDPGLARLLGVLSLQSLVRLATLNFRDVIGEGLPFSSVTGTMDIKDGMGSTNNFELVTAPARASMRGTIDLPQETQDLHVHVVPTLSVGAGVVAATIVNPLFGLGALIADFAFSQSVSRVFALDFHIDGSWAHPRVERLHGDRGNMDAPAPAPVH